MTGDGKITIVLTSDQYDALDEILSSAVIREIDLDRANDFGKLRDHIIRRTRERRITLGYSRFFEPQLDSCARCGHKYGSGCGDRCCRDRREVAP